MAVSREEKNQSDMQRPNHLGIIMDGNGRWATARNLARSEGHKAGLARVDEIVPLCASAGVKFLSLYVFSTENWKRPVAEVEGLFALANIYLDGFDNSDKDVRVLFSGQKKGLPLSLTRRIERITASSADKKGITVNLCLNYGGRQEISDASNRCLDERKKTNGVNFSKYLYNNLPDIDLVIRTGGHKRLSNFMLFQSAYAELYFTDCLWPDFDQRELNKAFDDYNKRQRNFGGI